MKGSSADCNRLILKTIHLKQWSGNSIKLCSTTSLSFSLVALQQRKMWDDDISGFFFIRPMLLQRKDTVCRGKRQWCIWDLMTKEPRDSLFTIYSALIKSWILAEISLLHCFFTQNKDNALALTLISWNMGPIWTLAWWLPSSFKTNMTLR